MTVIEEDIPQPFITGTLKLSTGRVLEGDFLKGRPEGEPILISRIVDVGGDHSDLADLLQAKRVRIFADLDK